MSDTVCALACTLAQESFGEPYAIVLKFIYRNPLSPLGIINQSVPISIQQIKAVVRCGVLHGFITFVAGGDRRARIYAQYSADPYTMIRRMRYPHYLYAVKSAKGDLAEAVLNELFLNGNQRTKPLLVNALARLKQESAVGDHPKETTLREMRDVLGSMLMSCMLQRSHASVQAAQGKIIPLLVPPPPSDRYNLSSEEAALLESDPVSNGPPAKKKKLDTATKTVHPSSDVDPSVHWEPNFDQLDQLLRDMDLVEAIECRYGTDASAVMRAIINMDTGIHKDERRFTARSMPITANELHKVMSQTLKMDRPILEQHLSRLCEGEKSFLMKIDESGGGMYSVNFQYAAEALCAAQLESAVQEKFGIKGLRIFRVLVMKKKMEESELEKRVMMNPKEAKEMTYLLYYDGVLERTEMPRNPDYTPTRTIFLYGVNLEAAARSMLDKSHKAALNALLKKAQRISSHLRLVERHEKMEAILKSMEKEEGSEEQRDDLRKTLTPQERQTYMNIMMTTERLDMAVLLLDETLRAVDVYLRYEQTKRAEMAAKRRRAPVSILLK